ncbi:hypothetical protein OEIGOIKO_08069 [Streptomyces chrestomyceticus JCM 4735]|uniref:CBS domain-containing protein n=1 Tax=Streptomyces chrestomyceticus JCM 4735 TaxID=1306181 RepID=A0A7U9L366_9ACTN|nr:CBS domain-containing protein [Streptomyces chrestomyceticus]GCD40212.1 hypothetical protein OEIGOIKO_08069 [Streptomyces chrestomyceticus JCM 4735]
MKHRLIDQIVNRDVVKTLPEAPFKEVTDLPARHAVSGVPVVDRDDKVLGVVSETDLMYRQAVRTTHHARVRTGPALRERPHRTCQVRRLNGP